MNHPQLKEFVRQSLQIEGIMREPTVEELDATQEFLNINKTNVSIENLNILHQVYAPGHKLRVDPGLNVMVGSHIPKPGGPEIRKELQIILDRVNQRQFTSFKNHVAFEMLHPYTDGNGRVGRALWWLDRHKRKLDFNPPLQFLHMWYYDTLRYFQDG